MSKFPKESKADRETSKFCPAVTEALVGVNRRDPPFAAESGVTVRSKSKVMLPVELTVPSVTSTEAVSTLTALRVVVFKLEVPAVKVVAVVDPKFIPSTVGLNIPMELNPEKTRFLLPM